MRLCRQAAVFALLIALAVPWVAGADPRQVDRAAGERSALSVSEGLNHLWSYLTSLWDTLPTGDAGPDSDPLGRPAASSIDEGPGMDPLGRPVTPSTDAGPGSDPLG